MKIVTVEVRLLKDYMDHNGKRLKAEDVVRMPPGEAASLVQSEMAEILEGSTQEFEDRRGPDRP